MDEKPKTFFNPLLAPFLTVNVDMGYGGQRMTIERFKTIAESIDLRMWPAPIEIKISARTHKGVRGAEDYGPPPHGYSQRSPNGVDIETKLGVADRITGSPTSVYFTHSIPDRDALRFSFR